MSKKIVIICAIFILAVGGGLWFLLSAEQDPIDRVSDIDSNGSAISETMSTNTTPSEEVTNQPQTPGTYDTYDETKLAEANGTKVLFFHAPWCPQCRAIDEGITPETLPNNVSIFKVDYDSSQDLRQKYGVTLQTTFVVIDDQGNLVKKHVAYSEPTFDAVKQALF